MNDVITGRHPEAPFRFFEEISRIPRGSFNEKAIADYLVGFAEARGLWCKRDEKNNVYIKKPGSPGCETLPPVVLQGHTDMVCEKNADVDHDFETDPIPLYIEGDRLRAKGTTLGADNGIGVAYMLAALDDKTAVHPPLECLFTSMEEVGLIGAFALDPALIQGRMMINMDSCPEGGLLINSAGGCTVTATLQTARRPAAPGEAFLSVAIRGLLGGHSGVDIEKERANSNKLLGFLLSRLLRAGIPAAVATITGGAQSNAIPREADVLLAVPRDKLAAAKESIAASQAVARKLYADSDPDIRFQVADAQPAQTVLAPQPTQNLIRLLNLTPNGRLAMSPTIPDLVTLSLNLGVVRQEGDKVSLVFSLRSASADSLQQLADDVTELAVMMGAACDCEAGFPTWEYKPDSKLFRVMGDTYRALRGKEPLVQAVHGGLECAVIAQLIPDMDIVAIGPDVDCVHTPDEWLDLPSFGRTYEYLLEVLSSLTKQ